MALGIDAAHGQFNWSFALADRSEKSDTLGAKIALFAIAESAERNRRRMVRSMRLVFWLFFFCSLLYC